MSDVSYPEHVQQWPKAVEYDLAKAPSLVSQVGIDELVEPAKFTGNFYRSVQWLVSHSSSTSCVTDGSGRLMALLRLL
jgi:hypothetical protein